MRCRCLLLLSLSAIALVGCIAGTDAWDTVSVARLRVGFDPPRPMPRCSVPVRVLIFPGDVEPTYGGYGDYTLIVHSAPTFLTHNLPWALSFYFDDVKVLRRRPVGRGYLLVRAKVYSFGTTKRVFAVGGSWGYTSRKYRAYVTWKVTVRWVGSTLRPFTHNRQAVGEVGAFRLSASPDIVGSALRQALQDFMKDFLTEDIYRQACIEGRRLRPTPLPRAAPPPRNPPRPPRRATALPRATLPPRKTASPRRTTPPKRLLDMPK
ncbi:MAG: hypothetical protein ABI333_22070 [bacterium]